MSLIQFNHIPSWLLDISPSNLYQKLAGPALFHIAGHHQEPLLVSVLLHGNETTGFLAVQELLRKYQNQTMPRSLALFIGNIEAARYSLRRLENQVDYNRVWPHAGFEHDCAEARIMAQVVTEMRNRNIFVSIDIHNNTGLNPHYACINRLEQDFYHLATLFSRTVIYFTHPLGVQSLAFADVCPAVTVECGQVGNERGIVHAREYIEACLGIAALPNHPIAKQDIDLFHSVATIKVPEEISFSFNNPQADLLFSKSLDQMNFSEIMPGTSFGRIQHTTQAPLTVINEHGQEMYNHYFTLDDHELRTKHAIMPSMLTTDEDIIRKDCLCYLMERMTHLQ